jgi:hypothetical protein
LSRPGLLARLFARHRLAGSPVDLCRRVSYEGFEHVHAARAHGGSVIFLIPASGKEILVRVLELFRPAGEDASTKSAASAEEATDAAHQALAGGGTAVPVRVRPALKGRFVVRFLSGVVPESGETAEALARRYLAAWEDDG